MTTVIVSALPQELEGLRAHLRPEGTEQWAGNTVYTGTLFAKPIVLALSGVGKAMAAATCQRICDRYRPSQIIFVGLAGALNPAYNVGDIVLAREVVQHDLDASPLGFAAGEIPYTGIRILAADPSLLHRAATAEGVGTKLHVGRVATGDQFIASPSQRHAIAAQFQADAVEMEGAAVGLVAHLNAIPWLIVRTISDNADGEAVQNFTSFLSDATKHEVELVQKILR